MRTQPSSIMSSASALAAIPEKVSEVVSTVQKALQPYAKVRAADGVCSAEQRRDVRADERDDARGCRRCRCCVRLWVSASGPKQAMMAYVRRDRVL